MEFKGEMIWVFVCDLSFCIKFFFFFLNFLFGMQKKVLNVMCSYEILDLYFIVKELLFFLCFVELEM